MLNCVLSVCLTKKMKKKLKMQGVNRPSHSCLLPLCKNESLCATPLIQMEMCFAYRLIFRQIKLIYKWKVCSRTHFKTEAPGN